MKNPAPHATTRAGETSCARKLCTATLAALVFTSMFFFHHNFFYRHGGYLYDAGANAFMFYRHGINPQWPSALYSGGFGNVWYAYHLSPTVGLVSLASYLSPLNRIDWFCFCEAVFHMLMVCAMCSLVDLFLGARKNRWWILTGGLLGLIYGLNGFTLSMLAYPHSEPALVAFGLCFLAALLRGRMRLAVVFLILSCGCREDAGFHLTAILFMLWVASFTETHLAGQRRRFLIFTCIAFSTSVALLVAQRIFFPHPGTKLSPIQFAFFNGEHTITWQIIAGRLAELHKTALSLILAVAASTVCAIATRKYVLLLGWVAYLPWFTLNLLSSDPGRNTLETYHVFPFIFAVAWPLMVLTPLAGETAPGCTAKALAIVFLLGICPAVGQRIAMPGMFNALVADLVSFHFQLERPFDALNGSLEKEPQLYGNVGMDDGEGCLALDFLERHHLAYDGEKYDTLVFFKDTMFTPRIIHVALRDGLDHCYELEGTNALVVSNHEIPASALTRTGLQPRSLWLSLEHFFPKKARRLPDGSIVQSKKGVATLAFGPYVPLAPGKYRVTFHVGCAEETATTQGAAAPADQPVATLKVTCNGGAVTVATADVKGGELPATTALTFKVLPGQETMSFEFCVDARGLERIKLSGIDLERL